MSTIKTRHIQIGSDADPNNNFTIMQPNPPDGSLVITQGNADDPGSTLFELSEDQLKLFNQLLGSSIFNDAIGSAPLYGRDSVVGTVSTNGAGSPAGSAWQKIQNVNGTAFRNAAGQQICYMQILCDSAGFSSFALPASFTSAGAYKLVAASSSSSSDNGIVAKLLRSSGSAFSAATVQTATPGGFVGVQIDVVAIGAWY